MSSPPTFQTDRLLLRPWIEDDLESFHSAVYSDPVSFYGYHENIEESFQTLDSAIWMNRERTSEGFGSWAVVRRLDNELVGIVNLDGINRMYYAIPQEDAGSTYISLDVEVGYAFGKQFRGQGYATEACQAVIDYAFGILRIRRLVTPANSENKGSVALLKRLGYQLDKNLNRDSIEDILGVLHNPLKLELRTG